jgi:hypothetical protein
MNGCMGVKPDLGACLAQSKNLLAKNGSLQESHLSMVI